MAEDVVVRLVLDTSNYTSKANAAAKSTNQISKSADKTGTAASKLTGTLGKLGIAMGGAFAAKVVFDFARSSIAAFSNLEESINAVNVSYLEGSDAIHALGENSATQFGLSTSAVNDAAVAMSAFADKIDAADPPGAFKNVLQRATDFASVMNLEVEEALLVFRSGLAGESEPLRKFGIDVSAATVNLVGLEAGLGGTNGKLDEGEKVQARYLAIMQQTEKVVGDFANTADGLANRQKILSAQWTEMQAVIGKELEPAMTKLLGVGTKMIPIFTRLAGAIGDIVEDMVPFIDLVEALTDQLGGFTEASEESAESAELFELSLKGIVDLITLQQLKDIGIGMVGVAAEMIEGTESARGLGTEYTNLKAAHELIDSAALRVRGSIGFVAETTEEATSAMSLWNGVTSSAITLAMGQAAWEREKAAGMRSVLAAQAEAASPALRLLRSNERLVASQAKLIEVQEDGEASAADLTAAELDLVGAQIEVDGAAANLAGRVNESAEAFIETAVQAGILRDRAIELAQELGLIPTTLDINLNLRMGGLSVGEVSNILRGSGGTSGGGHGHRQSGGAVGAGEPFIVGERGPELFLPNSGGQIVPNGGMGGTTIHIHQPETTDLSSDLAAGLIAGQVTQQVEMLSDF